VNFDFSLCPPLTRRKVGSPKVDRFKALFQKGGSSKKGKKEEKKDGKPKRQQKGNKNRCKAYEELGHRAGSAKCGYTFPNYESLLISSKYMQTVMFLFLQIYSLAFRKRAGTFWPMKKRRVGGLRKKRSFIVQTEHVQVQTEPVQVQTEPVETKVVEVLDAVFDVEVLDETIPAIGTCVRKPIESDVKKTKSMAKILGLEPPTSNSKTKKKKERAKKK
jgi:hypothetical protein